MRDIAFDPKPDALPVNTFVVYGDTRTGKTVWGATFPRPLIIGDATEGGYSSIQNMDRNMLFEHDVEPIIKVVENMNDMMLLLPELRELVRRKRVLSIVHDAFTYYCDFYLAKLIKVQTDAGKAPDNRQAYGSLGVHLRELRTSMHSLGVNVMWNCLAKHPDAEDPKAGPLIPGQQSQKFSAGVDFLFHSRIEQVKVQGVITETNYLLSTKQYGKYIAGNRLGTKADQLPDPFSGTYSDLLGFLGYDLEAVRAAMPKILPPNANNNNNNAGKPASPAVIVRSPNGGAAKNPVVITRPAPKAITPPAGK